MIDIIDDGDEELYDNPRDEKAIDVYERLEDELSPDESGHQRYSKSDASTSEAGPVVE